EQLRGMMACRVGQAGTVRAEGHHRNWVHVPRRGEGAPLAVRNVPHLDLSLGMSPTRTGQALAVRAERYPNRRPGVTAQRADFNACGRAPEPDTPVCRGTGQELPVRAEREGPGAYVDGPRPFPCLHLPDLYLARRVGRFLTVVGTPYAAGEQIS